MVMAQWSQTSRAQVGSFWNQCRLYNVFSTCYAEAIQPLPWESENMMSEKVRIWCQVPCSSQASQPILIFLYTEFWSKHADEKWNSLTDFRKETEFIRRWECCISFFSSSYISSRETERMKLTKQAKPVCFIRESKEWQHKNNNKNSLCGFTIYLFFFFFSCNTNSKIFMSVFCFVLAVLQ